MTVETYRAPTSLDELTSALSDAPATLFAGGTDLLPQSMAGRHLGHVLDVKRVADLQVLAREAATWRIGAAVPAATLAGNTALRADLPGLVEGAALIGSTQIQYRATLGGNVGNASPAADTVPALLANEARATVASKSGLRELAVADLLVGPGATSLSDNELIVHFTVPHHRYSADAALRFTPRTEMDIAVANAAARITLAEDGTCERAVIAIGGVGPVARVVDDAGLAITGASLSEQVLGDVAAACRQAADPIDDKRGTAAYRRHVVGVLAHRAVTLAWQRAAQRREEDR